MALTRSFECLRPSDFRGVQVRCNRCRHCLALKSWIKALRIELEAHGHAGRVWLCTLTFRAPPVGDAYSEVQKWLKRVRKHAVSGSVRYTCVSEFGSRNGRFHYHLVLYCQDDLKWRDLDHWSLGHAHFKLVTGYYASRYIAKYLSKGHGKVRSSNKLGVALMEKVHGHPVVDASLTAFPGAKVAKVNGTRVPRELQVEKEASPRYSKAEWDDAVSAPPEGDPPAISQTEYRQLAFIINNMISRMRDE